VFGLDIRFGLYPILMSMVATLRVGHHWAVVAHMDIRAQFLAIQLGPLPLTDGFNMHWRSSTIFHAGKRGSTLEFGNGEGALFGGS